MDRIEGADASPASSALDAPGPAATAGAAEYGSDLMADLLRAMGVRHVFINPGSSFRGLHDSVVNRLSDRDPQLVLTTHEMIAVSMAHGYAKASGQAGVAILHNLVGLLNGSMGVFNAFCDQVPLLLLGGSGPADPAQRRFIDWAHTASAQADIVRPFVKWAEEPATVQACLDAMLEALRRARTAPCGPTYVSLDAGLQEGAAGAAVLPDPTLPRYAAPAPAVPDRATLDRIAELLASARMPLIVGGRFGLNPGTTDLLRPLVELAGAAYLDDRNIVCMPTGHPQNLNGDNAIRAEADVILAIDCQDLTAATLGYDTGRSTILSGTGAGARATIIDISRNDQFGGGGWTRFGGPTPPADLRVDADPLASLAPLTEALEGAMMGDLAAAAADRRTALSARRKALADRRAAAHLSKGADKPIHLATLTQALFAEVRNDDWLLAVRNHRSWQEGIWDFPGSGRYLGGDGGGGVGYGPGAVAGAALALKDSRRLVVGIVGDGDFVMGGGAIWSAAHHGAAMLLAVANNRSWGNDELHQIEVARQRGRPEANAHIGQRMENPAIDIAAMARSMGALAIGPVSGPADLPAALAEGAAAARAGRVVVVEVITALG